MAVVPEARAFYSAADWRRFSVHTPAGPAEPAPEVFRALKALVFAEHLYKHGDGWAGAIAKRYGTTLSGIQATNGNELILLGPKSRMIVHNKPGVLYFIKQERETLESIIAKFQKDPKKAADLKEKVVAINSLPGTAINSTYELARGERLLLPGVSMDFDTYGIPLQGGWRVSSGFGMRTHPILKYRRAHEGWDLPKPHGTPVYPARSGRVTFAGWKSGYGQMVEVRHSDGARTIYGHLSEVRANQGQFVQKSKSLLGRVGSSGLSTGPHLHFEVRDSAGNAVNPGRKIGRR